ncbi:hypothetical protein BDK51DRAFT_51325 [Blyttiomyces helicus]|uniref:Uncharacterized protein n=1 Tax=Blyttiomyces helicus TaxID=388810 RepID=A0A4P9VVX9_9FUNG|nr:hypothetical protein BDK51DRAFT_51325 [Blyttiomyces helicus]|eukprot:RKO83839.1 hypothetical protein BDK51DRAFT_51325 [Blyttiomyces helicus]
MNDTSLHALRLRHPSSVKRRREEQTGKARLEQSPHHQNRAHHPTCTAARVKDGLVSSETGPRTARVRPTAKHGSAAAICSFAAGLQRQHILLNVRTLWSAGRVDTSNSLTDISLR